MGLKEKIWGAFGIAGLVAASYMSFARQPTYAGSVVEFNADDDMSKMWSKADTNGDKLIQDSELVQFLKDIGYEGAPIPPGHSVWLRIGTNYEQQNDGRPYSVRYYGNRDGRVELYVPASIYESYTGEKFKNKRQSR